jgi:LmbE family N-acetylglucosaminyl deacetylase
VRIIYLSPHLDDATLSAGGLIRAQSNAGMPVEIWTLMSGFPGPGELPEFAQVMHRVWGFASGHDAVMSRRLEDERAAAQLGAKPVHFDFLDAIYRRGKLGQALYPDVMVPMHPDDADSPEQIAQAILDNLRPDDRLVCQLAIGAHVDHAIVRRAAELLRRPLAYDADLPYLINHPGDLAPTTAGLQPSLRPISQTEFDCWISAIECYVSQVDSVFGSHEVMHQVMEEFWHEKGGIQLWTNPGYPPNI